MCRPVIHRIDLSSIVDSSPPSQRHTAPKTLSNRIENEIREMLESKFKGEQKPERN